MAKYTIRDIARMAGVSRSTVSLVLNESPSVSPRTRQRVLEVIAQANYRPSAQARGLVQRRAACVALLAPENDFLFRQFYLSDIINGALDGLTPSGYKLVIEPVGRGFHESGAYHRLFQEQRVDGALIAGARANEQYVIEMARAEYPLCLINCEAEGALAVIADNRDGARAAATHLAALGHVDIACITGPGDLSSARDRQLGFLDGMAQCGLERRPERMVAGDMTEQGGYEAMGRLLRKGSRPPTALFAVGDVMALGAIHRLRTAQLRVPEDVAVIGGDDILLASYCAPTLTTIRQPLAEMARLAAEILIARLRGQEVAPMRRIAPAALVIRESCGAHVRPA